MTAPLEETAVAKALEDPHARRILAACVDEARPVKQLARAANVPLASAYRSVHALVAAGLLLVEGTETTADGKHYEIYRSRVRSAEIGLDAAGEHVRWESNEVHQAAGT